MRLIAKLLVIAAAVWVVAAVVPGVHVQQGVASYLLIAVIFSVVNVLVRPVLKLLSFPLLLLTLGLFLIVINAAMFGLTALLTTRLDVDGFGPAVIASLILSAITWTGDTVLGLKDDD
ncbi:MAG TPA: phage holin family protein [Mycobacteriales bacterium]|jgi:putative membrane protein|nr:phage holin family protein [Mycobacteriales bacterium]